MISFNLLNRGNINNEFTNISNNKEKMEEILYKKKNWKNQKIKKIKKEKKDENKEEIVEKEFK